MLTGHIAALFTIMVWGVTFISTKILLADFTPEAILFIRFLLGWLALWLFSRKWLDFQGVKIELDFLAAGFFGVTLYFLLENIALIHTYASNVGVIVSSTPFFTALADWLFFKGAKPGGRFYAGFIIAMVGIALISFGDSHVQFSPAGDLLALLAAIAWAFYSGFTKKIGKLGHSSLITTRRVFFYGLLLMVPYLAFHDFYAPVPDLLKPRNLCNLLFLGIAASAICFATWTFCLVRLGAAKASAYIYLVPVVTVLAAALWLHEKITFSMTAGMLLVICGLALSESRSKKQMTGKNQKPIIASQ